MFTFSIRTAFIRAWKLFVEHWVFYGTIGAVMVVFNQYGHSHHSPWLVSLAAIGAIIWGYVSISVALAAVDGKDDVIGFKLLAVHMPTFRQFFTLIAIDIVAGLIVGVGIILLIIPGIYFLVRLSFVTYAYVDRDSGIKSTLKFSWHLVHGKIFWTTLLVLLIEVALLAFSFGIGAIVTYPLAILLVAQLYRVLTIHQKTIEHTPVAAVETVTTVEATEVTETPDATA